MDKKLNTYDYSVSPEEIDLLGQITVPALCRDIISAIGSNIRVEGYGIDVMARESRTWVLLRSAFEIDSRPGLYAPIHIAVWPSPTIGLTFNRSVILSDGEGREIGKGVTEWCVLDISTRRPICPSLSQEILDIDLPCRSPRRIKDFEPEVTDERKIGYSECDFNGHLNNNRYVEMMYDMLPDEMLTHRSAVRLDINFRHEVRRGESVSLGIKEQDSDNYLFIARSADRTLCSASLMKA